MSTDVSTDGGAAHRLSRSLFHFFRLKKPQAVSVEPSINPPETKGAVDRSGTAATDASDIHDLVVSRDGRHAFAGLSSGDLVELELVRPKAGLALKEKTLVSGPRAILAVALSKNERYLAVARFGIVQIYDRFQQRVLYSLTKLETRLSSIDWDPRTELVVIGGVGGDIYTWNIFDGPGAGRDTLDAVEQYEGNAPVVRLLFHPSARAFFAAQQDGKIVFWRLLRTERELGLRDEGAVIDAGNRGSTQTAVANLPCRPESLWLESGGEKLFASCADGKLYRWKVRGLERQAEITFGADEVTNMGQLPFVILGKDGLPNEGRPFFATGRGQRLSLYCPRVPDQKLNTTAVSVVPGQSPTPTPVAAVVIDGRIEEAESPAPTPAPAGNSSVSVAPIAVSERFDSPIQDFAAGADSAVLWAVQKAGTLAVFDATQLVRTEWFEKELGRCLSRPGGD